MPIPQAEPYRSPQRAQPPPPLRSAPLSSRESFASSPLSAIGRGHATPIAASSSWTSASTGVALGAPSLFPELERQRVALAAEREHFADLGRHATDAFEEHRAELTQLAQKERAIRGHREDALRAELQETLQANSKLMARVAEQRRQAEEAWVAELRGHRDTSAHRHGELETTLTQLHGEWAALQRATAETEALHEERRCSLAACLRDQERLRGQIRSLQSGLTEANAAAAATAREEVLEVRDGHPADARGRRTSLTSVVPSHLRQATCSHWDGTPPPLPKHRTPRLRFVPSGPWDACSPTRAASPCTHHVDAMVATIERSNYLRPRLFYHRAGRGPAGAASATASPLRTASPPRLSRRPPPRAGCPASLSFPSSPDNSSITPTPPPPDCSRRSPGLSSSSSSSTTAITPTSATYSAPSSCSCSSSPRAHKRAASPRSTPAASARHPSRHTHPPHTMAAGAPTVAAHVDADVRGRDGSAAGPTSAPVIATTMPHVLAPPAADGLHGTALNAACRCLIADLAAMRSEYRRHQRQLRDPRGESVSASQAMRTLMHRMDAKADQIRTLRREQGRHKDALRVQDVLREVIVENRYCEAVYNDLMELIRA
ncbi:hypothetical protein NESM_000755400 [Novymonas esmeraldas]|uniref:Uncharacterized protein n=1 Tax=Novymonas esmeraldas TaxID=1808958 RepID=A0AAW0EUT5_9TRYP